MNWTAPLYLNFSSMVENVLRIKIGRIKNIKSKEGLQMDF